MFTLPVDYKRRENMLFFCKMDVNLKREACYQVEFIKEKQHFQKVVCAIFEDRASAWNRTTSLVFEQFGENFPKTSPKAKNRMNLLGDGVSIP
jgi:hypothetical protein